MVLKNEKKEGKLPLLTTGRQQKYLVNSSLSPLSTTPTFLIELESSFATIYDERFALSPLTAQKDRPVYCCIQLF